MELRDFFTQEEIRSMKERIVREACTTNFMVKREYTDEDGVKESYKGLTEDIKSVIRDETVKLIKEHVKAVINETVKDKVSLAVEKFTENLCKQLGSITEKTNWYWNIKS